MATVTVRINDSVNNGLNKLMNDVGCKTIRLCAQKYGFSEEEALALLGFSNKKKMAETKTSTQNHNRIKLSVPIPFVGFVFEGCCNGLKSNHGLYTQCMKTPLSSGDYCPSCQSQADKNSSGKPNAGSIHDRMNAHLTGNEFRDPKGHTPVHFSKIMQKLNISESDVRQQASKLNVQISDEHFVLHEAKRGRPKKILSDDIVKEKSPRGRPKKTPKPVESSTTEDLFATLISQAKANSNSNPIHSTPTTTTNNNDTQQISVKRFELNGVKYLLSSQNILYDPITQDPIAILNPINNSILPLPHDDDDEEDEDEDEDEDNHDDEF